jgi:LysR family hydrogen peroxide-inducible transcriptional activator
MTDLKRFEYVLALAECLNFSQAAAKLNISQSTLSQQIQKTEKEIGVALFDRTTSTLTLTQYGQLYIKGARKIIDAYNETLDSITDADMGASGSVTVGIAPSRAPFLLPGIVKEFRKLYPEVGLNFAENKTRDIMKDLIDGNIDFAYTVLSSDESLKDFEVIPVTQEEVMLVCRKGKEMTALREDGSIDFKKLGDEKFIALQDSQMLTDYLYTLKNKSGSQVEVNLCVSELSTAIAMVKEGLGIMLLPSSYKNYGTLENELDFYRIRQVSTKRKIAVIYRKDKYINKPMKALIEILVKDV